MALYDAEKRKIVVRVVYDGPGHAGKTTNVRELERVFNASRRTEIVTPEEIDGRTQYFDFVQIEGGLVLGHAVRCQVVSVPGQPELMGRRRYLLESADAVVFVCAATDAGLEEAAPMYRDLLAQLESHAPERRPAVVVQLNKHDLAPPDAEARALEVLAITPGTRVVLAQADRGIGVRDTIALAMRAAAERAQAEVLARGIDELGGRSDDANGLLLAMQRVSEAPPAALVGRASGIFESDALAPPHADVPAHFVWPSDRGPEILRRFAAAGPPRSTTAVAATSGAARASVTYESGLWTSVTTRERVFESEAEALRVLAEFADMRVMLGVLLPRNTAMVVSASANRFVLHTVRPGYATLGQQLAHAARSGDARSVEDALLAYGSAIVDAMGLAIDRELRLAVHPDAFASVGPALYYVDESLARAATIDGLATAILGPMAEFESFGGAIDRLLVALERAFATRFSETELRAVGLVQSLESFRPATPFTLVARPRLLAAAMEHGKAPAAR